MLALLTHQFPELMGVFAKAVSVCQKGGLGEWAGKTKRSSIKGTRRGGGENCHTEMVTRLQRLFAHCLIFIIISGIKVLRVK
jgi:hypothetical protein